MTLARFNKLFAALMNGYSICVTADRSHKESCGARMVFSDRKVKVGDHVRITTFWVANSNGSDEAWYVRPAR